MNATVRPIQPADYEAAAALHNTLDRERRVSGEGWRAADARADEASRTARYVALAGEPPELMGYGAFWRVRAHAYRLELQVAPAWRRQGIGRRLLRHMLDALALRGAASVQARTDEGDLESLTFLWRNGFVETQRMYRMRLNVAAAALEPWRAIEPRLAAQGIAVSTLAYERAHDPAALRKLYDLHSSAQAGWREAGPEDALSFDEYARRFAHDAIVPDGFFIAKQGELYVGYSGLAASTAAPQQLQSAGTVVRPEWRRRGVATALKLRTIDFAQRHGYGAIVTHTASPSMLALDVRLGFQRERTEARLVLALS